jgi:hypothetical protein
MSQLRWLSILFGLVIFVIVFSRKARYQRNGDKLLFASIATALILLGIYPDWINGILRVFSFQRGHSSRIIGLLLGATFFIYILVFRLQGHVEALEHTISRLVNELAKQQYRQEGNLPQAPIAIIIPAYNEEENIGSVLAELPEMVLGNKVIAIVTVDGSTDQTEKVVRNHNVLVATHIINRGGGAALHVGYDLALESGAQIIVSLDADGQHVPGELERLITPILNHEADLVNGSRVLGTYEKDQQIRAFGVVVFNWLISVLTMQRITDCSNAYRAITAEALAEVRPRLRQRQFHSTELLLEVIKSGRRVKEVPITVRRRLSGESKKGPTVRYAIGFTYAIVSTWLR